MANVDGFAKLFANHQLILMHIQPADRTTNVATTGAAAPDAPSATFRYYQELLSQRQLRYRDVTKVVCKTKTGIESEPQNRYQHMKSVIWSIEGIINSWDLDFCDCKKKRLLLKLPPEIINYAEDGPSFEKSFCFALLRDFVEQTAALVPPAS
jgi:hypothetical protein